MTEFKTSHKLAAVGILLVILIAGFFALKAAFQDKELPASSTSPQTLAAAAVAPTESPMNAEQVFSQQQQQQQQQQQGSTTGEAPISAGNGQGSSGRLNAAPISPSVGRGLLTSAPSGDFGAMGNSANLAPEQQAAAATPAPIAAATTTQSQAQLEQANERLPMHDGSGSSGANSNVQSSEKKANKDELEEIAWIEFKSNFSKSYSDFDQEKMRRSIFSSNWRFIDEFNGNQSVLFTLGVNQFADLTRDEINAKFVGPTTSWQETISELPTPIPPPMQTIAAERTESSSDSVTVTPQTIDWRNVTSGQVVDQANCTDSAVFAAVASIESAYNSAMLLMNPYAVPLKLSERQALTCLSFARSDICKGGASMAFVFRSLQYLAPDGLSSAQAFDQGQVKPGTCELPAGDLPRVKLATYSIVHEDMIPEALNSVPLVVALDASQTTFHFYKSGLYHQLGCDADSYNQHALLVGYSAGDELEAHYLLRNSWGSIWGESGHMRLLKNKQINTCLPLRMAMYPNLAG